MRSEEWAIKADHSDMIKLFVLFINIAEDTLACGSNVEPGGEYFLIFPFEYIKAYLQDSL